MKSSNTCFGLGSWTLLIALFPGEFDRTFLSTLVEAYNCLQVYKFENTLGLFVSHILDKSSEWSRYHFVRLILNACLNPKGQCDQLLNEDWYFNVRCHWWNFQYRCSHMRYGWSSVWYDLRYSIIWYFSYSWYGQPLLVNSDTLRRYRHPGKTANAFKLWVSLSPNTPMDCERDMIHVHVIFFKSSQVK